MKKNGFFTAFVLLATLVIGSCNSAPKVYDKSVPLEQSSTLEIGNCFVKSFSGESTLWSGTVIIPAGQHTLVLHNSETMGTTTEYGEVSMTYEFLPGHTYAVFAPIKHGQINGRIIDIAVFNTVLVPDPTSPDASPLEGKWKITDGKNSNEFVFAKDEYIRWVNGVYYCRGFAQTDGNTISMTMDALYDAKKEKWVVIKLLMSGGNITYNGTSWVLGKFELQKIE